ncbi:antibacterial peptide PMAP-23-like isoform X2 [Myotis daubentonii]|uniref:antibacterial peptide PMAP-23-like isoform X2 n=1 Tax=Myotis daubentonii TaxID=98922 RepID=UPI0028736617|nr:antibacterial peptide PMAP-23-like isoform X2 [Myotis daubentonii]
MATQRNSLCWGRWPLLLLLLGLAMPLPPAAARVLSYQEAVRLAVQGFNQRSREASLYRLLQLDPQPQGDLNPDTPTPISFTLKETVCPRTTRQPPEECDFKKNGLVKVCAGTVTLDQDTGYFDFICEEIKDVAIWPWVQGGLILWNNRRPIGRGIQKAGRGIKRIFSKRSAEQEP